MKDDKEKTVEIDIKFENIIEGGDGNMYYYDPDKDQAYKLVFDKEDQDKK